MQFQVYKHNTCFDISQIDSEQFEKILGFIRSGNESNATLECGGGRFGSKGYYVQPTVFSNVQVCWNYYFV